MRRRQARELAMKALFARDVGQGRPLDALAYLCGEEQVPEDVAAYARTLVQGVLAHLPEIDRRIATQCREWSLPRLAAVDRNVLRVAVYELLHGGPEVPVPVAISEAVEVAEAYGGEDSGRFVNGVLGELARGLPQREGQGEAGAGEAATTSAPPP
jgi:N utilization substance protein B